MTPARSVPIDSPRANGAGLPKTRKRGKLANDPAAKGMDSQLIDRIYESSFVPEHWPGVLDELGRTAEATGGSLFITKAEVLYWTASPEIRERAGRMVNEGWFWPRTVRRSRVSRAPCRIFD
jgi:hypothetical protein